MTTESLPSFSVDPMGPQLAIPRPRSAATKKIIINCLNVFFKPEHMVAKRNAAATWASSAVADWNQPQERSYVHQGSLVKSQLLYQQSYAGAPVIVFAESSPACRRSHGRPPALLSNCCQTSKLLSNLALQK